MEGPRTVIPELLQNFRAIWRQLLGTHVIYNFAAFALLTPLATLLLKLFISISGESALADEDILFFVLRPMGLVALMFLGALVLSILALEHAALMTIGFGASHGQQVQYMDALVFASRRAWSILKLTFQVIARALLYAAPFLAVNVLIFFLLLTKHDINYYLFEKPPVFWVAFASITLISGVMILVLLRVIAGWVFALPLLLFNDISPSKALRSSALKANGRRTWIIGWLMAWLLSWVLLAGAASGLTGAIGGFVVPRLVGTIGLLSFTLGAILLLGLLLNAAVIFLNASTLSLLMVRLYRATGLGVSFDFFKAQPPQHPSRLANLRITGRTALWGCIGGMVVASFAAYALVEGIDLEDRVQIVAHRGASAAAPENTLAAVERAIYDGADWVEIDVQETAEGRIVVIHDSDLKKIAGNDLRIRDATLDQVQSIDVGSWFDPAFADQRVPTLEQVLETCKGRTKVNIELKYYGSEKCLTEQSIALVEAADMANDVVMMSLNYEGIRRIREMRRDWKIGFLAAAALGDVTKRDVDFLAVSAKLATRPFVRRAHRRGKEVLVWTVNDPIGMSTMISRGVDGIITDEPALARSVLAQRAELSPPERLLVELAVLFGMKPKYVEQ